MANRSVEGRKMQFVPALLATIFVFASGTVFAGSPNYKYVEIAYSTGSVDLGVSGVGSVDIDQDGFELEGSVSFFDDRLWLLGSFTDLSGDEMGVDLDVETIGLGVGGIFSPGENTTIDVSAIYREDELSAIGLSEKADGVGLAIGVRSIITPSFELFGRLGYLEGDYEGSIVADLGGIWNINDRFAISAAYERLDVDEQGVEIEFGQFQLGGRVKF